MNPADFEREPCHCAECYQAGVTALPQRRDPWSGAWLHGYALKRWHEARDHYRRRVAAFKFKSIE